MSTEPIPATEEEEVRVALDLPKSVKDRLEREALEAKQAGEINRSSQAHIVLKALRLYWAEQAQPKRRARKDSE